MVGRRIERGQGLAMKAACGVTSLAGESSLGAFAGLWGFLGDGQRAGADCVKGVEQQLRAGCHLGKEVVEQLPKVMIRCHWGAREALSKVLIEPGNELCVVQDNGDLGGSGLQELAGQLVGD